MRKLLFGVILIVLAIGLSCSGKQQHQAAKVGVNRAQAAIQEQAGPMDSTMTHKAMADTTKAVTQDTTKASIKVQKMAGHHEGMLSDKGIGPIKEVKLDPVDPKLAKQGQTLFNTNCTACHTLDVKKIGPPLRGITQDHAPEFIMNMILNPTGMQTKNEEIKALAKQYGVLMSDLHLKEVQARAILEYLRSEADKGKPAGK